MSKRISGVDFMEGKVSENLKISIIIPVKNMEKTIARTLQSIIEQSYKNVEVIVVDGKSDDRTLDQIRKYDRHLTKLISEPDDGLYAAINKGLACVSGEIIAILNGDDYYSDADVLRRYAEKFSDQRLGLVLADIEFFNATNVDKTIRVYSSSRWTVDRLRFGWMPPHPAVFVRKHVYETVGRYHTDYKIAADFEWLIRALFVHAFPYGRINGVQVRMQHGGTSTRGLKARLILNNEILRACRENGLRSSWFLLLLKLPAKLWEFSPMITKRYD